MKEKVRLCKCGCGRKFRPPDMAPSNHDTFPCSRTENLSRRSDPGNLLPKAFSS